MDKPYRVKKYLIEYMFGEINQSLMWCENEEVLDEMVEYLMMLGEKKGKLTYLKKYKVEEIE